MAPPAPVARGAYSGSCRVRLQARSELSTSLAGVANIAKKLAGSKLCHEQPTAQGAATAVLASAGTQGTGSGHHKDTNSKQGETREVKTPSLTVTGTTQWLPQQPTSKQQPAELCRCDHTADNFERRRLCAKGCNCMQQTQKQAAAGKAGGGGGGRPIMKA